ncbi:hypothetical protein [Paenibacillus sp. FSL H3-0333]|uniref:hypothetical protein n=1 Tax=Paenibacillus sp. FSL H3-0333 TaxID=2921373 RepID=UPI0030FCF458
MDAKEKISYNLKIIDAMFQDGASPPLDEYWDEIVDLLSQNLHETKDLLFNLEAGEIERMSGYFEDVAANLQDVSFIKLLKELQQKHTNIDISQGIQWALDALE